MRFQETPPQRSALLAPFGRELGNGPGGGVGGGMVARRVRFGLYFWLVYAFFWGGGVHRSHIIGRLDCKVVIVGIGQLGARTAVVGVGVDSKVQKLI